MKAVTSVIEDTCLKNRYLIEMVMPKWRFGLVDLGARSTPAPSPGLANPPPVPSAATPGNTVAPLTSTSWMLTSD